MRKGISKSRKRLLICFTIASVFTIYYQMFYKRHYLSNNNNTKYVTIWKCWGNNCYIIPYKYFGVLPPTRDYIKTRNYRNYIGILWNTTDTFDVKISIYNDYERINLDRKIKTYQDNDSLLFEYKILDMLDYGRGIRKVSANENILKEQYDYKYIDLSDLW